MARKPSTTFEPGDEPGRCCAKAKHSQKRCRLPVVPGRRVCRLHGGLGGRPPTTGRYSQGLGRFREAYQEARQDPALLDLRETLALMDVVVQRAVERIEEHDTPDFRKRALNLFEEARAAGDAETTAALLGQLGALLKRGASEDKALERVADTAERLARRQEKAWSIKLDAATALNARDLMAVLARFADIVLEEVPKDAAARVIRRIDGEIVGTGPAAVGLQIGDPT